MKRESYKNFILKTLCSNGGSMERQNVIRKFEDKFLHGDGRVYLRAEELGDRGTETYWSNELSWARNELKDAGMLKRNSPFGLWELTPAGVSASNRYFPDDRLLYKEKAIRIPADVVTKIKNPEIRRQVIDILCRSV